MSEIISKVKSLSNSYFEEIRSFRHHLHSNPELSFEERETANFIEQKLHEMGISETERIAETGVTFCLGKGTRTIALRADIDALPIEEKNEVAYRSKNNGVMHACGHDVHTSSLLGAAKILHELRDEWGDAGVIKFIFQPAEEKSPGGASILIKEGILENPKPQRILGQHVMPLIEVGKVGFRKGKYMASADEIYLTVKGKGGHAAMPENFIDPIAIASQVIVSLQQVVSRIANPKIPSVLSFGKISGGSINNVIPDEVRVEGTFRTFDEEWRKRALDRVKSIATGVAESMGGSCEVEIADGYPFLANNETYTEHNMQAAREYLGEENVEDLDLWMAAEDFAFYSHHVDACFYRLGTRNEDRGITSGVHTPTFDIDEEALKTGMGLMAYLAISEIKSLK